MFKRKKGKTQRPHRVKEFDQGNTSLVTIVSGLSASTATLVCKADLLFPKFFVQTNIILSSDILWGREHNTQKR